MARSLGFDVGRQRPPELILGVRPLERRRLLDAGAASLLATALDDSLQSDTVQTTSDAGGAAQLPGEPAQPHITPISNGAVNSAPTNLLLLPDTVSENGFATLTLSFNDPDLLDGHSVSIDWKDGSPVETFNLSPGTQLKSATHQYLDDAPTITPSDVYHPHVVVTDDALQSVAGNGSITVNNVAPSNLLILPLGVTDENGSVLLTLSFNDSGTLDQHAVEVDWGDGTAPQLFNLPVGNRVLNTTHQYQDDNPTGTTFDPNFVKIRITDDDGGLLQGSASVVVLNVAPSNLQIEPIAAINENGLAQLKLAFDDPGTKDTHTVEVDWGDGSAVQTLAVPLGDRTFATTHQYLDDNPTGTSTDSYAVKVRLKDDDSGETTGSSSVVVNNVAPLNLMLDPIGAISENGTAQLNLTFDDPGTLDTHTVEILWGDGSPVQVISLAAGQHAASASHQYVDDNPTGTPFDSYSVVVRVLDDDTGQAIAGSSVVVNNVAPLIAAIDPIATIDESGIANLKLSFTDPGTFDTHTVEVDWGDGSAVQTFALPLGDRTFSASHQFVDDNPTGTPFDSYTVKVRVLDDDMGEATGQRTVQVNNVGPTNVTAIPNVSSIDEGSAALLAFTFEDVGTLDTHDYVVNWGDGFSTAGSAAGHFFSASHVYADNGTYAVKVRVTDDDGGFGDGAATVTVLNVNPTLSVVGNQFINEGSLLSLTNIGQFRDPGFDNPLNVNDPGNGGETAELFNYTINWGDGTLVNLGSATIDASGSVGVLTQGSFDGSHTYADNGLYTVTVSVFDDDLGEDVGSFTVSVQNVNPTLTLIANQAINEGSLLSLPNIGQFTDPGFANSLNVNDPSNGGETTETFSYSINWGDGTTIDLGSATIDAPGSVGVLTTGSFDGSHTYADNGLYTVTVTVFDDDLGQDVHTFSVTVANVNPTLSVVANQTINEGSLLSLPNIGQFTDPGFDNPLNVNDPLNGAETVEMFTFSINWGDGTAVNAGAATIDAAGSVGILTTGSFDGSHTYADNGSYTVTVSVFDDDLGVDVRTFSVTVFNVDPTLSGIVPIHAVNEGQSFTLAGLGVRVQDPGFDNLLNAGNVANGGETQETFLDGTVDWGDGTAATALSFTNRVSGSAGAATTADFVHSPHVFADNGDFTVTLQFSDDDGPVIVRTLTIHVDNVAPILTLTSQTYSINEGDVMTIPDLGTFTDPGFDNALNAGNLANGGEVSELFTYTINWGDGTIEMIQAPASRTSGSPGMLTVGTLSHAHHYLDNDTDGTKDNHYTVVVTLADDDGGVDQRSIQVTVLNVNPTLQPIFATDVTTKGETTLNLTFSDPGADSFEVLVDWGDKLTIANPENRFVVETVHAGATPQSFVLSHKYAGPPDPLHPAANIVITAKIRDDDFGAAVVQVGQSNLRDFTIKNPGIGNQTFRIDTTPKVPLLAFPQRSTAEIVGGSVRTVADVGRGADVRGSAGQSMIGAERYLELRVIEPDGKQSEGFRLKPQVLANLPALFRNLPDNHYAIYLVQAETNVRRLVIEVFVRNGKLIDPGDDSEGGRDRPPTDDATKKPPAVEPLTAPDDESTQALPALPHMLPGHAGAHVEQSVAAPRPTAAVMRHRAALASAAVALVAAKSSDRRELDRTIRDATAKDWRRLRTAGKLRRRVPR